MARPLMAQKLVEIAQREGAFYIAHGCTGKGNDQVRFETAIKALDPAIKIIAPWRSSDWDFQSREEMIEYAEAHNIPIARQRLRSIQEMKTFGTSHMKAANLKIHGTSTWIQSTY